MRLLREFLPYLRPFRLALVGTLILSVLFSLLSAASIYIVLPIMEIIFPQGTGESAAAGGPTSTSGFESIRDAITDGLSGVVVDDGSPSRSLLNLCVLVVILFVLKNIVKFASGLLNSTIQQGVMKGIRDDVFGKSIRLPVSFFNKARSGDMISVVTNEVSTINAAILPTFVKLTRNPVEILTLLVLLLALSPTLTAIAFSTTILTVILIRLLRRSVRKYSRRMQRGLELITARLQEAFQNVRIIKAFSSESFESERFSAETGYYRKNAIKHAIVNNLSGPIGEIVSVIAIAVVIFFGGSQVLQGTLQAEELITFLLLLFSIMGPVVALLQVPTEIARGVVAAERVLGILQEQREPSGSIEAPMSLGNEIEFHNVEFAYHSNERVLREINFKVNRGETVALVGPSGGGKSTLVDLLIRLYDPTDGTILLDGVDVSELTLDSYRALFGIVTQEPLLFHDTIWANIAYGEVEGDESRVRKAAVGAYADEFIRELPDGYDTIVGDRGLRLSGGQRQRIAIARALYRDPEILLLDEATSALDTESEAYVQKAIDQLLEDRTAIIIAHRLSTIRNVDRIVVVDNGKIVEVGDHAGLLEAGGVYAGLYGFPDED